MRSIVRTTRRRVSATKGFIVRTRRLHLTTAISVKGSGSSAIPGRIGGSIRGIKGLSHPSPTITSSATVSTQHVRGLVGGCLYSVSISRGEVRSGGLTTSRHETVI